MNAIVYTSNTGYTAQYAALLGEKTGLPVYDLAQAKASLPRGAEILYLGWLMASVVKGYGKAKGRYCVRAVCGVGMAACGSQQNEVRKANRIPQDTPLFTLQGGFDITRLKGVYKFMMNAMAKGVGGKLAEKPDKTAEEADMLDLMLNGGNRVSAENLAPVLAWLDGVM